jgi:hypothetical protein
MGVAADRVGAEMYVTRRNRQLYRRGRLTAQDVDRAANPALAASGQ